MATVPHATYGVDGDFAYYGCSVGSGVLICDAGFSPQSYRAGISTSAVCFTQGFGLYMWPAGGLTSGWFSSYISMGNDGAPQQIFWGLTDASGNLRIYMISSTAGASGPYKVYKKDAEGNSTLLFTTISGFSGSPSVPDKMDVQFDYAVEGSLNIYINKVSVGSCTATDITTDGQTEVFGTYHASYENTPSNYSARFGTAFSECHVSDTDTRDVTCYTMTANNAGTLDQWTGSFTNVDEITVNDLNFDTTTTSGDTQRYLMTALPTGNFVIDSVFTNLRCTAGGGDLSQIAVAQLIGGVSYITSPQELPVALVAPGISFKQTVNPATGLSWQPSDFGITFESGYQALT